MTGDLFNAGFAWSDEPEVSQAAATPDATPTDVHPRAFYGEGLADPWRTSVPQPKPVASVAAVAETEGQRLERLLSQPLVARVATPVATPRAADFCGVEASPAAAIADVASVAGWEAGIATLTVDRLQPGVEHQAWSRLVRDARQLMRLWGHDLHAAGWSVCDVFGVEADLTHRRLDRVGLVALMNGGEVEAIDSDLATIRWGKDRLTYRRQLRGAGSVPIWAVSDGEGL